MEFLTKLFPPEGMFVGSHGTQAVYILAAVIWAIITYWVVKAVLGRACKGLSNGFRHKLAQEQRIIEQLTAKPVNRDRGFIQGKESFYTLERDEFPDNEDSDTPQFATGCFSSTQDWDYNYTADNRK